jgi:FkbM family methyltransferase
MLCYKITPSGINDPDAIILKNIIKENFLNFDKLKLLQIGANDGISADPIYDLIMNDKRINAYLVEPQKESFELLSKNYSSILEDNRILLLNYAITNKNEKIKIYINNCFNGTDGHSSLIIRNKLIIDNILYADFNENSYELVNGITFEKLKDITNVYYYDIIVIDTEGYDIEIIKMMFDNNIFPKILYFEKPEIEGYIPNYENNSNYIINNSTNIIINLLNDNNYSIQELEYNWLCIKK